MDYEQLLKEMSQQKDGMTTLERMIAYAKGEEVDHIPFMLIGADTAASLYGYTMGDYRRDLEIRWDIMEKMEKEFGTAAAGIGLGLKSIGEAVGSTVKYPEEGIDFVADHVLKDYSQLDSMDITDPYKCPNLLEIIESFKKTKERFPHYGSGNNVAGPISTAASIRRVEDILRDTVLKKDELHRLLDYSVQCTLRWVEVVTKEFGPLPVNISDPVASMSVLSKKQFLEFEKPHLKDLVEGIKNITGRMPTVHICGKTRKIWEDLLELGFTSLSVDNCEDIGEVKECVGDRMRISGNVPPVEVLKCGSIDEVIQSVHDCIQKASDSQMGYALAAGCQIPPLTPRENLYAYIYAARKYGRGAKKGQLCKGLFDEY